MARSGRARLSVAVIIAGISVITAPASAAGCAEPSAGGDWPSYGSDHQSTRSQPLETAIGPSNVSFLEPVWKFSIPAASGTGATQSTYPVAEGCAYVATSTGEIFALNADDGSLVWRWDAPNQGTIFGPAVRDGVVYANIGPTAPEGEGPYVVAIDSQTGVLLWQSDYIALEPGVDGNTSAVHFDDMLWVGIDNPESGFHNMGGYAFLDASTGEMIKRTFIIPPDQVEAGFAGGGPWTTPAVDPETKFGYFGSAQPSGYTDPESELTNAIIKFDFDRDRATFGEVVGAMKGNWDSEVRPDNPIYYIDVDFGASPTLVTDADGRQIVAELQKSGWVHAAYTRYMTHAWSTPVLGWGTALGNYTSLATDGTNLFGVGTYPGIAFSLNGSTGMFNWITPIGPTVGSGHATYANGVVYYPDDKGILFAFDAATGVPLLARQMTVDMDGSTCGGLVGTGVTIARNTIYVPCAGHFIAYRPASSV